MMIVVVMGVCGSGKTTVSSSLAEKLGWKFFDADDYHSEENKEKMAKGIPLNDEERIPWLCTLHEILLREYSLGANVILACSSLKTMYRSILMGDSSVINRKSENYTEQKHSQLDFNKDVLFVHLHGSMELIMKRLETRKGHFMSASLLQSQFDSLEPPGDIETFITISIEKSIPEIVAEIEKNLGLNL
ncbi:probable gluconokinase isoform X2 [Pristis pectinata]|uniref:probable gluconokinase isoform X2 n=1 Tax=Pristis pectinata TaxID=685728 RepID=UPI00223CFD75|nr:probable gluconokinase isoform X2 [Pristis pectinata]